jgi:hypothetical protein
LTAYSYGGDVVFCVDVVVIWSAYSRAVVYVLMCCNVVLVVSLRTRVWMG